MIMDQLENNMKLVLERSGTLKAHDAIVYSVGVGSGMDDSRVKRVASKDDYAFYAPSLSELMSVAPLISEKICPLKGK